VTSESASLPAAVVIVLNVVASFASRAPSAIQPLLAPYELVREIGSRPSPLYVVKQAALGGKSKLLIAERVQAADALGDAAWATFVAEARRISTLASANVARVRQLIVRDRDLVVVSDFIDGDRLEETWLSRDMSLDVALRLVLDLLAGASAIHGLRDGAQQPLQLAHGELSPATVVVGVDGAARVLHAVARRAPGAPIERSSRGYVAPEVHAGAVFDPRADVFSAGVLLWEALNGARLFLNDDAEAVVARTRAGVPPATANAWAKGLAQVAARALAHSPADRWPTATAMAEEIRKAAGLRLASAAAAAAFGKTAMGERVKARRQRLESGVTAPATVQDSVEEVELLPESVPPSAPPPGALDAPRPPPAMLDAPPPLPARATPPSHSDAVADVFVSVTPPISVVPPPADSAEVLPTSVEQVDVEPEGRSSRRRVVAVLGGVGALGLVIFSLAGWRAAHRSRPAAPSASIEVGTSGLANSPRPPEAPAPHAQVEMPTSPATQAAPALISTVPSAAPAKSAPAAQPGVAAGARSQAAAAARPRKSPSVPASPAARHSGFDPNAL
jgi:eukaryotic-like serine/threonine-protein kinase